jgi:HAMP domain-containing protein
LPSGAGRRRGDPSTFTVEEFAVHKLITHLRIGEKIAIGFGIVGLLFLGVIWQYQDTLNRTLNDYRQLQEIQAASKDRILSIKSELLQARLAEKRFRLKPDVQQAQVLRQHVAAARSEADSLATIDAESARLAGQFNAYLQSYLQHFEAVEAAWSRKGLDEDSGLQGSFRDAVHDLEAMAQNLNTDRIYLNLLQIRRGEKDLGLRRDGQYQQRVNELIGRFQGHVRESQLPQEVKEQLLNEIIRYRDEFTVYAEKVLAGGDLEGGKGPFREAAHRLEALINQHYVPDLERDILQLRRREKDYLLRGGKQYVEMALKHIETIEGRIRAAGISDENREEMTSLLQRYRDDFLLLVEQNHEISSLTELMDQAANHVTELVKSNVDAANRDMQETIGAINTTSKQRTDWMFWVVVAAIALGIFFAIMITRHIVQPMRRMAVLLEQLTYTELVDPLPHVKGGRDEINGMAGYLNTLAEHRNRFIHWWESSMNEAEACKQLRQILQSADTQDATAAVEIDNLKADLLDALSTKKLLISKEFEEVNKQADMILDASAMLQHPSISRGEVDKQGKVIHYAAELIRKSLQMLSRENTDKG